MKKTLPILIALLILLQMTSIGLNVNVEQSLYISSEKNVIYPIKIAETDISYTHHYGPVAMILAHRTTSGYYNYLTTFKTYVRAFFPNVIYLTPDNASDYLEILEEYPEYAQYLGLYGDLYVYINPYESNVTDEEINVIQYAFENGRSVMITGECNYYDQYHPDWGKINTEYINPLVSKYGVSYKYDELKDPDNYTYNQYYVVIWTWYNNTISNRLSEDGSLEVESFRSTHINIDNTYNGTNGVYIYRVGIGDDNTTTYSGEVVDGDINAFVALTSNRGGKMFLAGGSFWIRDPEYYGHGITKLNNTIFVHNILSWFNESIEIYPYNISVPEILPVGTEMPVYIYFANFDDVDRTIDVEVSTLGADSSVTVNTSTLPSSALVAKTYMTSPIIVDVHANEPGLVLLNVTVTATSTTDPNDVVTFTRIVPIKAVSLDISIDPESSMLSLVKRNDINVTVTVTNPTTMDSTNTIVNVTVVTGSASAVNISPGTNINIGTVTAGTSVNVTFTLEFSDAGEFEIEFATYSEVYTSPSTKIFKAKVYGRPLAVLDNYHPGTYYKAYNLENLTAFLSSSFDVYILNTTFTSELLEKAHLVIIPRPDTAFTPDEINALREFVRDGGTIIISGDGAYNATYFTPEIANEFLSYYGVEFLKGQVHQSGVEKSYWVSDLLYEENEVASILNYKITMSFNGLAPINITTTEQEKDGLKIEVYPTLVGGPSTYVVNATGDNVSWPKVIEAVVVLNTSGKIIVLGSTNNFKYEMDEAYMKAYLSNRLAWAFGEYSVTIEKEVATSVGLNATIKITVKNTGFVSIRRFNFTITSASTGIEVVEKTYEVYLLDPLESENLTLTVKPTKLGTFTVTVTYRAGGIEEKSETVTVSSTDSVAPEITVSSPENNSEISVGNATIAFTVTDNYNLSRVIVEIDGTVVKNETVSGTSYSESFSYYFEAGEHTIVIKAYDEAGNSKVVTIIITASEVTTTTEGGGFPWALVIVAIVGVAGVAAVVFVYLRKLRK